MALRGHDLVDAVHRIERDENDDACEDERANRPPVLFDYDGQGV
jgi:hypothetical protein